MPRITPATGSGGHNTSMSLLDELLLSTSREVFLREHYLRLPFAASGGGTALTKSDSAEIVRKIIDVQGADVLVSRNGELWRDGPISSAQVPEMLQQGFTIGLRHCERHDPELEDLAARFESDFEAPVDVHLYWTPAGAAGLGWHYDVEDVFLLQTRGKKEWSLRKNTVNPWPILETLPQNMRYERETSPMQKCLLHAGDWLYVPAGYWHSTFAPEESISISVGLLTQTGLSVLDYVTLQLAESMLWRQRLPVSGTAASLNSEELQGKYRSRFEELAGDLARLLTQPWFAERYLEYQRTRFGRERAR